MQELTQVFEFIKGGGAMAIVALVAYALLTGRLRLGRECDSEKEQREKVEAQAERLVEENRNKDEQYQELIGRVLSGQKGQP